MTEKVLSDELHTHPLKVADIVSYLNHNGWQAVAHPNKRLLVFQGASDDSGNSIQLVLPSQNTFEDSERLLAKVINQLAAIEDKSPPEIIGRC
ncbi:MAG: hypothetical protein DSM106950_43645 [Stigonema ocellatum SAG 48.90 = DSM 106950]|nr:hypothetical protein [Stigonema ocellatum SAG 48.90 = DSM 106950]